MNNATRLKQMNKRAKAIQAARGCSYKQAQKQAGAEMRAGKSKKSVGAVRKKKPKAMPKKKRSSSPRPAARRTRAVGSTLKSKYKKELEEKLAWQLLARESAHRVRDKKKKSKAIAETKKELRAVGGLKRR